MPGGRWSGVYSPDSIYWSRWLTGKSGLNLLTLLIDILDLVQLLATHTANHTHSNTGAPTNSSELAADAKQATSLREKYGDLIA